jgi:hypothetical protein
MQTSRRILYGLDRLPRAIGPDDPRLPGVIVGSDRLRFNTEPLPPDAASVAVNDHASRVAAMAQCLDALCGDYAPQRQRFIRRYLDAIAAHVQAHGAALATELQRYHGLYAPEDWTWSALRPLPRAWLPAGPEYLPADIAFWDGAQAIAIELTAQPTDHTAKLQAAGIIVCRIAPHILAAGPARLLDQLPASFREFWRGQRLPVSPFRRPIPRGALADARPEQTTP